IPVAGLSPSSLTFAGQIVATRSAAQAVTLTNTGDGTLNINQISTSGDFAQTNNCAASLAAGATCTINVTFTPSAMGSRSGSLTLSSDSTPAPSSITLSGTGLAAMATFSPSSLSFASQMLGTSSTSLAVTLTDSGNADLTISSLNMTGDFSQTNNCGTSLSPGASCTINVVFTPQVLGSRTGSLFLTSNSYNSPGFLDLSGTGLAAVAAVSPSSLTFAGQLVGTSSTSQAMALTNNGNISL